MSARLFFPPARMTRETAAYYIDGTLRDIDDMKARGEITPVGNTKRIFFLKADLDSWLERQPERGSTS